MQNKILLIDGHSILNRAFYGLPLLTNSKGTYTNAVYGFLNIIFKVIEETEPDYIAVAFDLSAPTFRHRMYDAYKGTRKPMPEELRAQVPLIKQVLSAMDIRILEQVGFEADDLIGSAAALSEAEGLAVIILSGDRDLLQLVSEQTTLKLPKTGRSGTTVETFTPARVEEVYQVTPAQIVDLKAMMGDSSDNIPGLPGVGEKTATTLVRTYGTLENAHAHLEEVKPKKAMEALRDHYELGQLSKELATIRRDAPLGAQVSDLKRQDFYTPEAYTLFKELEFKNYYTRFDEAGKSKTDAPAIRLVTDLSEAEMVIAAACEAPAVGLYLDLADETPAGQEKTQEAAGDGRLAVRGLALAFEEQTVCLLQDGFLTESYLTEAANRILAAVPCTFVWRFKEQNHLLRRKEVGGIFDCVIAAYLLDPLRSEYSYSQVAGEYAGLVLPSEDEVAGEKITKKTVLTAEQTGTIAGYTAYMALRCGPVLRDRLTDTGMLSLFETVEMPFVLTLSEMELAGIRINTDELKAFSEELKEELEKTEKNIYEQAGETFNIQSPKQLGVILFEKLKLPGGRKTKSGYSTAVDVLEKLAEEAPIVKDILTYRQLAKLKSTYADTLGDYADADGRIHSHFLQTVTATGRISSADPNLQNIPVRMELGRRIRRVFVPAEGCVFVDADYSQIELRLLAHLSADEKLIEAYNQESDIHRITASQVFGVPFEEVTPLQRRNAKAVNFGIVYGISSFGLSQDLSITRKEAQAYIEKYFQTYPGIKTYLDGAVADAKRDGYTTTMFGRRRPIPELKSTNYTQRSFGERVAMNAPIQGAAADIIKIAMNNVTKRLEGTRTRLILQVHDELLLEAPTEEVEAVSRILKEEMEKAAALKVRLEVDLNTGSNWDEAH